VKTQSLIPILAILLGLAIAGLGLAGIVWIVASHSLGHGLGVIAIFGVFIVLGATCIFEGVRQLRSAPTTRA
jgi:type IV secretory pathway VirB2 component (pilin)